jgi:hypothetical protein
MLQRRCSAKSTIVLVLRRRPPNNKILRVARRYLRVRRARAQPPVIGGRRVAKRSLPTMMQRSPSRRRVVGVSLLNRVATAHGLHRVPVSGRLPFLLAAAAKLQARPASPAHASGDAGIDKRRFHQRRVRSQATFAVQPRLPFRKPKILPPPPPPPQIQHSRNPPSLLQHPNNPRRQRRRLRTTTAKTGTAA